MNASHDREIVVFNEALRLPATQRPAYLLQACAGDANLHCRVQALLQAHERAGAFLQESANGAAPSRSGVRRQNPDSAVRLPIDRAEKPGARIGRYKILQQIGEGGCGVVYMAEQEEPVHRQVALKVIKSAAPSSTRIRKASFTATSSLRTFWSRSTMASRCPR